MSQSCRGILLFIHDDERGTSLTEFVIALPIFVLIMGFIYYMGIAGNGLVDHWNIAQRDLWTEVQTIQRTPGLVTSSGTSVNRYRDPGLAAQAALTDLDGYGVRNMRGQVQGAVETTEQRTLQGLNSGGHWGESYQRTRPPNQTVHLFREHPDNSPASSPSDVIGGSGYARGLVNDGSGAPKLDYSGENGLIPAIGAGVRYGVVQVIRDTSFEFTHHWEMEVRSEFNVLVPPAPRKDAAAAAMDVARAQLNAHNPYRDLPGISKSQPMRKRTAPGIPPHWSIKAD